MKLMFGDMGKWMIHGRLEEMNRQTDRQTDRHPDRAAHTQTGIKADKQWTTTKDA